MKVKELLTGRPVGEEELVVKVEDKEQKPTKRPRVEEEQTYVLVPF